jgi:hypothetical protein
MREKDDENTNEMNKKHEINSHIACFKNLFSIFVKYPFS